MHDAVEFKFAFRKQVGFAGTERNILEFELCANRNRSQFKIEFSAVERFVRRNFESFRARQMPRRYCVNSETMSTLSSKNIIPGYAVAKYTLLIMTLGKIIDKNFGCKRLVSRCIGYLSLQNHHRLRRNR